MRCGIAAPPMRAVGVAAAAGRAAPLRSLACARVVRGGGVCAGTSAGPAPNLYGCAAENMSRRTAQENAAFLTRIQAQQNILRY